MSCSVRHFLSQYCVNSIRLQDWLRGTEAQRVNCAAMFCSIHVAMDPAGLVVSLFLLVIGPDRTHGDLLLKFLFLSLYSLSIRFILFLSYSLSCLLCLGTFLYSFRLPSYYIYFEFPRLWFYFVIISVRSTCLFHMVYSQSGINLYAMISPYAVFVLLSGVCVTNCRSYKLIVIMHRLDWLIGG